jgi:hypothetical protein
VVVVVTRKVGVVILSEANKKASMTDVSNRDRSTHPISF